MKRILLVITIALLLTGCGRKIDKKEYEKYLIDTYGDLNFQYVSEDVCNWFELGSCSYYFTSNELNGETFYIVGRFEGKEKTFEDIYIKTKYDNQLKKYYSNYFNKLLINDTEISSINIDNEKNIPTMTFEEYLNFIESRVIEITIRSNVQLDQNNKYLNLSTSDKSVDSEMLKQARIELNKFVNENYDIDYITKEVENIIVLNNLNNISKVNFTVDGCRENDYYVSCSSTINLYSK